MNIGIVAVLYFVVLCITSILAAIWPKQVLPWAVVMWAIYIFVCMYPFLRTLVVAFVEGMVR